MGLKDTMDIIASGKVDIDDIVELYPLYYPLELRKI